MEGQLRTIGNLMAGQEGRLELDLGNQEHRAAFYHHLGVTGTDEKEKMKEKYPALCRAIEEFSLCSAENAEPEDDYRDKYTLYAESIKSGKTADDCISSVAEASTLEEKQIIAVRLDIYNDKKDKEHRRPIYSDDSYECDTQRLLADFVSGTVAVDEPTPFTAVVTYTTVNRDGSLGKPVCVPLSLGISNNSIVMEKEAYHPKRLNSKTPGQCVVCYNRTATPDDRADYAYADVKIRQEEGGKKLSVHLPFAGYIRLNPKFRFAQFLAQETEITISIDGQEGECSYPDKSIFERVFQMKDDVLSWNFKEDRLCRQTWDDAGGKKGGYDYENWNNTLLAKRVSNNVTVSFYAKIAFTVCLKGKESPIPHHVIFSSEVYDAVSSTQKMDYICLWWGCLAGQTKIRMADGSERPISEIRQGDRVRLADGRETTVDAVLSGREEEVIHIVTDKHELLASSMHPVLTERGLVRAKDLNAADRIAAENGYEKVQGAYQEKYQGMVYNLRIQEPGNLIADGVISGDFDAQQSQLPYEQERKEWKPYNPNPVADDLAMLLAHRKPVQYSAVENMAAKPYYACRFVEEEGSSAVLKLKGSGALEAGAFSMEFWIYIQGESRELFSQESGFRIMADENTLVIMADEQHVYTVRFQVPLRRMWNQIFLTSDGEALHVGINGFETDCFALDGQLIDPDCDLVIGRHFSGYIRRIILYREYMEAGILRLRMFQNICSGDMEHLAAFLDGIGETLRDIGPYGLRVLHSASCKRAAVAGGFVPAKGHGACLPNGRVQLRGKENADFSVYVKCFILPYSGSRSVLWSSGDFNQTDAVWLYFERKLGEEGEVKVKYAGTVYEVGVQVISGTWQDLIVSYDASSGRLSVYQNGRLAGDFFSVGPLPGERKNDFCVGNGWDGVRDYPADALFTTVAVYHASMGGQKAAQLYASQPFVLDPQLAALFGFENGNGKEFLSGQGIYAAGDEWAVCSAISAYPLSAEHYWYDIDVETGGYSPDAEKVFRLFSVYMKTVFGIATDSMNEEYMRAVCWYMEKNLLNRPYMAQALSGRTEDDILCGVIREFHADMEKLLNLTYANHPYNRIKSRMADKMGINSILASVGAIVSAGEYAVDFEPEALEETFGKMRDVLHR